MISEIKHYNPLQRLLCQLVAVQLFDLLFFCLGWFSPWLIARDSEHLCTGEETDSWLRSGSSLGHLPPSQSINLPTLNCSLNYWEHYSPLECQIVNSGLYRPQFVFLSANIFLEGTPLDPSSFTPSVCHFIPLGLVGAHLFIKSGRGICLLYKLYTNLDYKGCQGMCAYTNLSL